SVPRRYISEIVEVRLAEILEFINNDLKSIHKAGQLPGGIVLVGGGAKTPGFADLVRQELRLPSRVGIPDLSGFHVPSAELSGVLEDPEYACAIGLVLWGLDKSGEGKRGNANFLGSLKKFWSYIVP
ncbi:MAG: hypothetical protein HYW56_02140, partial [Candidatus Harrisonbacteria bacterium]|nr:hypothetical protein [Candidatus Harrisonbacteria bacterium]